MSERKRIGIFGGTFNPIHIGHLILAEAVREEYALEKVIFVPAAVPPHKEGEILSAQMRLAMVVLATKDNPYFTVSDVELRREGKSYTVDTVKYFKKKYGDGVDFYFIAGTDTIHDLPTWKHIDELLELCHFIGGTRPDGTEVIDSVIEFFGEVGKEKIHRLKSPELEISSTDIRRRIKEGKSVRYMMLKGVIQYIVEHNIYKEKHHDL